MIQMNPPFWFAALVVAGVVGFYAGRVTLKDSVDGIEADPVWPISVLSNQNSSVTVISREGGVPPAVTRIPAAAIEEPEPAAPDATSTREDLAADGLCPFSPGAERFQTQGVPVPFFLCLYPPGKDSVVSGTIRKMGRWPDCDRLHSVTRKVLPEGRKTGVIVDVGANIGSCSYLMAAQGHTVFALEPNPTNIALIRSTQVVQDLAGEVVLVEAGASDTRQSAAKIFKDPMNSGNNVVVPEGVATGDAAQKITTSSSAGGSVRLVRLDDIVQRPVDVIKMDCQGCEVRALKGARALFMQHGVGAVVTEFAPPWLRAAGAEPIEMLRLLSDYGYEIRNGEAAVVLPAEFEAFTAKWAQSFTDIVAVRQVKAARR